MERRDHIDWALRRLMRVQRKASKEAHKEISYSELFALVEFAFKEIVCSTGMLALMRFRHQLGGSSRVLSLINAQLQELFLGADQLAKMTDEESHKWIQSYVLERRRRTRVRKELIDSLGKNQKGSAKGEAKLDRK